MRLALFGTGGCNRGAWEGKKGQEAYKDRQVDAHAEKGTEARVHRYVEEDFEYRRNSDRHF